MTEYLHHIPGRLRIRSKVFRCQTPSRGSALRKLRAMDGVTGVRLNEKAGSVTVSYDTELTGPQHIMGLLKRCECMKPSKAPAKSTRHKSRRKQATADSGFDFTREVSKIAFNVVVSRGVSYSLGALLGARA